jgi:hypothetical protein
VEESCVATEVGIITEMRISAGKKYRAVPNPMTKTKQLTLGNMLIDIV